MAISNPRFSRKSIPFLKKASRQKNPLWLDRNREDYETLILQPLQHLAQQLKSRLGPLAPFVHYPQKGIGRLKRPAHRASKWGGLYKDWIAYSASRPSKSRFDHNPSVFFLMQTDEPEGDNVLIAGGLYMPSSRQLRAIRESIAEDASAFDALFKTKSFAKHFPGGFSDEKKSSRPPRGFDPNHARIDWLKLQAYFVWKAYSMKEFTSPRFADQVVADGEQILKLNALLDLAIEKRLPAAAPKSLKKERFSSRLEELQAPRREMDF